MEGKISLSQSIKCKIISIDESKMYTTPLIILEQLGKDLKDLPEYREIFTVNTGDSKRLQVEKTSYLIPFFTALNDVLTQAGFSPSRVTYAAFAIYRHNIVRWYLGKEKDHEYFEWFYAIYLYLTMSDCFKGYFDEWSIIITRLNNKAGSYPYIIPTFEEFYEKISVKFISSPENPEARDPVVETSLKEIKYREPSWKFWCKYYIFPFFAEGSDGFVIYRLVSSTTFVVVMRDNGDVIKDGYEVVKEIGLYPGGTPETSCIFKSDYLYDLNLEIKYSVGQRVNSKRETVNKLTLDSNDVWLLSE